MARRRSTLVLEDGSRYEGWAFGAERSVAGETVFQTGMVGYPESLTDPSYKHQLLCLTYPMIGNYGVPPKDSVDNDGLPLFFESEQIHAAALIVSDLSPDFSHWNAAQSLSDWLKSENVPGIYGVDTRALTKKLRTSGSMLGKIVVEGDNSDDMEFFNPNKINLVDAVSCKEPRIFNPQGDVTIVAVDVGLKYNQIRCLTRRGAKVKLVPWNYNFVDEECDGVFLSNGPGDPAMCEDTIKNLRQFLAKSGKPKPLFGICLGHQLLSIAIGATSFKMSFGNRGHNQPCTNKHTDLCFITSQNHGFAVDPEGLPEDYEVLFTNENDFTNEGICHKTKPVFSVQFHPEANAGPKDLELLFDVFVEQVRDKATSEPVSTLISKKLRSIGRFSGQSPERPSPKKVLLLGSGGLSIGQAGEFDYSGSQAIKALKEEGISTVLINPNIATVQTMKGLSDKVYFLPVTPEYVEKVIEYERPDGVMLAFGGQTALNCGVELYKAGVFQRYDVQVLGTPVQAIVDTEDREIFSSRLAEINESCCPSIACTTVHQVIEAARQVGYPVMMRASFALGGLGSGVVHEEQDLQERAKIALSNSPQVTIERSLRGWKEIEYEVVRDCFDNTITVCNMENFDPLGIHTGESIVVAPSQTLSDHEYNMLRSVAVKVVRHIGIVGECNIQYALNPESNEYFIVEVNARLSRSSALASKATGYPLAYVAAKLALGQSLRELRNSVTRKTTACFEPSLDYCVVKIPRWDLGKFPTVDRKLGTSMKSVGEVMAIGRIFEEAFQKALRMVDIGVDGFDAGQDEADDEELQNPSERRVFALATAIQQGYSVEKLYELTKIDKWFLHRLKRINDMAKALEQHHLQTLPLELLRSAKQLGFCDKQIGRIIKSNEVAVRKHRLSQGLRPCVKQIDTVAAEYPAYTNYLYLSYNGTEDDVEIGSKSTIVLGSGVYRIGSSVEFDYCAVGCIRELRRLGHKTIMINYNPETVSTDYDECDRLYFDELSFEVVMDVYELETSSGVVLSMGGQIPNNIATALHRQQVNIFGTSPEMIDGAENRYKFSRMCDSIGVDQPKWKELTSVEDAIKFAEEVKFPCLMRPSYILSGTAMRVAHSATDLAEDLKNAVIVSRDHPVVLTKFILDAKEIEIDAVASQGELLVYCISEHIENAGVHSGDATIVHPPQDLTQTTMDGVVEIASKIAKALHITGPFNIQFIAKDDKLKVIETNVRCSRSFPFVSKTAGIDMIAIATRVMVGADPNVPEKPKISHVGVKVPQFSFNRLAGADPTLGVDMISTGEVACFGNTREEAYIKAMVSTSFKVPRKNGNILLSIGGYDCKQEFMPSARTLQSIGFTLYGSLGTADFYSSFGIDIKPVDWLVDSEDVASIKDQLVEGNFDLVINLPMRNKYRRPASYTTAGALARRVAVDHRVPLITNIKCAKLFVQALKTVDTTPRVSSVDCRSSFQTEEVPGFIDLYIGQYGVTDADTITAYTKGALAGGVVSSLIVLRGITSVQEIRRLEGKLEESVACDFKFIGSARQALKKEDGIQTYASACAGLFVDMTLPETKLTLSELATVFQTWVPSKPLFVKAAGHELASILFFSEMYKRNVHIVEVATKQDIELVALVKAKGVRVTCSVAVLDLFSTSNDAVEENAQEHRQALWDHLDVIDSFTTGHGRLVGKAQPRPAAMANIALPMLLTSVSEGRLTLDELFDKCFRNSCSIVGTDQSRGTYVEVLVDDAWQVSAQRSQDAFGDAYICPFTSRPVVGRVSRVVMHEQLAFLDGRIIGEGSFGKPIVLKASGQTEGAAQVQQAPSRELIAPSSPSRGAASPAVGKARKRLLSEQTPAKSADVFPLASTAAVPRPPVTRQVSLTSQGFRNTLKNQSIVSVKQFDKECLHALFNLAHDMRVASYTDLLKGKILASVFYEPSTRTQCSFASAMERLGGSVVSISQVSNSSVAKGESLEDFVRTMECYSDAIVLRHPEKDSVHRAAALLRKPLINAGDGVGEHPTQALLDVFTIREELGTVNNLIVTLVGDLKHGRTVHSLARLLANYRVTLRYVAPESLQMPHDVVDDVQAKGIQQTFHRDLYEVIHDTDVLYVTRIQKERFASTGEYEAVKGSYVVTPDTLTSAKSNMIVMHPLPRVDEISTEVDTDSRAAYFRQMEYGVYVRMALLAMVLDQI